LIPLKLNKSPSAWICTADQMNQTKELVKLSDGSDAGKRAIEPKLYSIQQ